jgi:predicted exporter
MSEPAAPALRQHSQARRWIGWIALILGCAWVLLHARFSTDMSAFLPQDPSAEQQLLVDQIRDGALSRMLLLGIEGGTAEQRAQASTELAAWMRASADFEGAINGDAASRDRDGAFLLAHRYALSDRVSPQRFSATGLTAALGDSLQLLASPAGSLFKPLLPRDPTAEMLHVLDGLASASPSTHTAAGVLATADGQRALLMAMLRAPGTDTDAQQAVLARIHAAFAPLAAPGQLKLVMTGAPYFAVASRDIIKSEVERLSAIGTVLVVALLLAVYRSPRTLLVGLLPVATGILAAVAAVALGFGTVHAITIGFGTTLIGESIDFSIYYLVQSRDSAAWHTRFWPTIRLGVATSLCGFGALAFSSFPGLAQLGLYSVAGLVTAALVTRYLLPAIATKPPPMDRLLRIGSWAARGVHGLRRLRWPLAALALGALVVAALSPTPMWSRGLDGLNPVPRQLQDMDAQFRAELGAGNLRWLVAVPGATAEAALARAERLQAKLQPLQDSGALGRLDTPSRFLPSAAVQAARLASIPDGPTLAANLTQALATVPFQAQALAPFVAEAEAARAAGPFTQADLAGTSFALGLSALMLQHGEQHMALLALNPADAHPANPVSPISHSANDAQAVEAQVKAALAGEPGVMFIDMDTATRDMFGGYLAQAGKLAALGVLGVIALLALSLRRVRAVVRVLLPLAGALLVIVAAHGLAGQSLTLLHLVGLMLVVAVGSNYALYFEQAIDVPQTGDDHPGQRGDSQLTALASLLLANLSTMVGFGVLAFSQVPVLQAIGATVGPGALLALLLSAAWSKQGQASA